MVESATTTRIHQHQERFTAAVGKPLDVRKLPYKPRLSPIPSWLLVSPIFHKHTLSTRLSLSGAAYPS
jgi:hypothetical protein